MFSTFVLLKKKIIKIIRLNEKKKKKKNKPGESNLLIDLIISDEVISHKSIAKDHDWNFDFHFHDSQQAEDFPNKWDHIIIGDNVELMSIRSIEVNVREFANAGANVLAFDSALT